MQKSKNARWISKKTRFKVKLLFATILEGGTARRVENARLVAAIVAGEVLTAGSDGARLVAAIEVGEVLTAGSDGARLVAAIEVGEAPTAGSEGIMLEVKLVWRHF
jgi:hypothetical protein